MSKRSKGILKAVPVQQFKRDPPPHLKKAQDTPPKEEKPNQLAENLNILRKPLLKQEVTIKTTDLDALFNVDHESGKNTSGLRKEATPAQNEEMLTMDAEEPQTEEALQPESGCISRLEGTDDVKRSKSPQGGASTPLGLDEPTEPIYGIEEIPNHQSNAVNDHITHRPEWPCSPQRVIDLLKITSRGGCKTPEELNIPLKDREINDQMPEIVCQPLPQGPLLSPLEMMEYLKQSQNQNTEPECMVMVDHGPRKGMTPTLFPFTMFSGPMDQPNLAERGMKHGLFDPSMQHSADPMMLAKKKDLWLEQYQSTSPQPVNKG